MRTPPDTNTTHTTGLDRSTVQPHYFGWLMAVLPVLAFTVWLIQPANAQTETLLKLAPNAVERKLDNGLHVVVVPDNRAPVVTHMLWYEVGAADEPVGLSGIAHFLEHLMFKGTTNYPDSYFSNRVAAIGGQENAFTSQDYTAYFQRIAPEHLEEMMRLEADRMRNLILSDAVVLPERDVVLEERASRVGNNPSSQLSEALNAVFYKSHPYGTPIIGWEHEIKTLSLNNALDFYRSFYTPENAILIIAGDVTPDMVFALADEIYGALPKAEQGVQITDRNRVTEPPATTARSVTLEDARVTQPSVRRAFAVPSYTTAQGSDAEALSLLAEILAGGSTSRMYRALVLDDGPATIAGGWYQGTALNDSQFHIYAVPKPGTDMDKLIMLAQAEIDTIKSDGVSQEELDRVRRRLLADTIYSQDSQSTLARIIGAGLTTGQALSDIQNWPAAIAHVTREDIQRVAQTYLTAQHAVTGFLKTPSADAPQTTSTVSDEERS